MAGDADRFVLRKRDARDEEDVRLYGLRLLP